MTTSLTVDKTARFARFVDAHRERAIRTAWRLCGGNATAAEEVAQEAFVRAWHGLHGFREEAELSTWFYRILVREAGRYRRWRAVRERWAAVTGRPEPTREVYGDPGLRKRIGAAVESLSPNQREVFVLVHLEGFTVKETAEITGRAPGTVKSHLHRALVGLRAALADLKKEAT